MILSMPEIHQLRLVVYPTLFTGFFTSQLVIAGFQPSTISMVTPWKIKMEPENNPFFFAKVGRPRNHPFWKFRKNHRKNQTSATWGMTWAPWISQQNDKNCLLAAAQKSASLIWLRACGCQRVKVEWKEMIKKIFQSSKNWIFLSIMVHNISPKWYSFMNSRMFKHDFIKRNNVNHWIFRALKYSQKP